MPHRSLSPLSLDTEVIISENVSLIQRLQQMRLPNLTVQWMEEPVPTTFTIGSNVIQQHQQHVLDTEVTQAVVNSDSPMDVAMTILTVFVLSPLIICSNSLLLAAFRRYKRLRTPSNCLVASLAIADMGVGLFLPLGVYFELSKSGICSALVCLLPYCTIIVICSVSILSMAAIALDRYTSLARPLRYNNIITKTSVGRYVAMFWMYALLMGTAPIMAFYYSEMPTTFDDGISSVQHSPTSSVNGGSGGGGGGGGDDDGSAIVCSFDVVGHHVRIFLFCMLYAPCALVILFCYIYVYIVARYHAHAIYSVELSMRQNSDYRSNTSMAHLSPNPIPRPVIQQPNQNAQHHTFHPRYGRTLALTVGLFLILWTPFQVCMLLDALNETVLLRRCAHVYLAFIAFINSALNPWVYGYRNTEFRLAYQRILEDLFNKLGMSKKKKDFIQVNGELGLHSCASNVRLCVSPNHLTMTTLLKPTFIHAPENTSCANYETHSTTVVVCETIITTAEQQ